MNVVNMDSGFENKQKKLGLGLLTFETKLIDHLKNLYANSSIYNENELKGFFGNDCEGINACYVKDNNVVAIHTLPVFGSKDIKEFVYSCNIIHQSTNKKINKILCSRANIDKETSAMQVIQRNDIVLIVSNNDQELATQIVALINSL